MVENTNLARVMVRMSGIMYAPLKLLLLFILKKDVPCLSKTVHSSFTFHFGGNLSICSIGNSIIIISTPSPLT